MLPYLVSISIVSALAFLSQRCRVDQSLTPDGHRYLALARGQPLPIPFAFRRLAPAICSDSLGRWVAWSAGHAMALPLLVAIWLETWGLSPVRSAFGGLMILGFPGVWRIAMRAPVLVDASGLAWATAAATMTRLHWWPAALMVALGAGAIKESAPVFATCFALNPLPMIGLGVPLMIRLLGRTGPDVFGDEDILIFSNPLRASMKAHAGLWTRPSVMLLPWGCGILGLATLGGSHWLLVLLTIGVSYSQLAIATDTVRLYQWASPAVALATAAVVPACLLPAALVVHVANPWKGEGY